MRKHFACPAWNHCTVPIQHAAYSFMPPYRLWAVLPAHDLCARPMAVSEGAIMQHPAYRHFGEVSSLLKKSL
jgi:hypothetical protein